MFESLAILAATPAAADIEKTEQVESELTEKGEQEKEETEIDTCANGLGVSFLARLHVCNARHHKVEHCAQCASRSYEAIVPLTAALRVVTNVFVHLSFMYVG
jgi:hypothetical protein